MSEQDTREKLEVDIRRWATDERYGDYYSDEDIARFVIRLLDRQAMITREECKRESIEWQQGLIDKLNELDNTAELIDKLTTERDHLKKVVHIQAESFRKLEVELAKMKKKRNANDE